MDMVSDMTSEGFGDMFEGDSADMCKEISAHVDGGTSRGSSVRRPGSKGPHRRERKLQRYY
jgi:hypothetical protein